MNTLLVSIGDITVYENDLVRYYTDDLSTIQFGIAIRYDEFDNRLTVRATVESSVNPFNIIENYREEEWQHITFDRHEDHVLMSIYPFNGYWTITEKQEKSNRIIVDMPYSKYSTYNWKKIEEIGLSEFETQLKLTAYSIISNEIMEFSLNTVKIDEAADVAITRNLPYSGSFDIATSYCMSFDNPSLYKTEIFNKLDAVIKSKILTSNSGVVDMSALNGTKVALPYKFSGVISFDDILNNVDEVRRTTEFDAMEAMKNEVLSPSVIVDIEENEKLPYREFNEISADTLWEFNSDYIYNMVSTHVRQLVNGTLSKKYNYETGTPIVEDLPWKQEATITMSSLLEGNIEEIREETKQNGIDLLVKRVNNFKYTNASINDLPWIRDWNISMQDIYTKDEDEVKEMVVEYGRSIIQSKVDSLKYGSVITKDNINVVYYITGGSLGSIADYKLKEGMIEYFEDLLSTINMNYWYIKTVKDAKTGSKNITIPIVENMEKVDTECNSQRYVYRVFIRNSNAIYRAFLIIENKRRFKGVMLAAPHIYSQNSVMLRQIDQLNENPLDYKEDYLKYLINNKRNAVLNMVEAESYYC